MDLLDRLTIIRTLPYTVDEMATILGIRAKTEGAAETTGRGASPDGADARSAPAHGGGQPGGCQV